MNALVLIALSMEAGRVGLTEEEIGERISRMIQSMACAAASEASRPGVLRAFLEADCDSDYPRFLAGPKGAEQ